MKTIRQIAFAVIAFAWTIAFGQVTPPKGSSSANVPTGGGPQPASVVVGDTSYQLPVGINANNRSLKVGFRIGGYGQRIYEEFDYEPQMGPLNLVVKDRVKAASYRFTPKLGMETQDHVIYVAIAESPYYSDYVYFKPKSTRSGGWLVPSEALDQVEVKHGSCSWKLQGVTAVAMKLYLSGEVVKDYSTKNGTGGDTPCEIGAANSAFKIGWASVAAKYGFPELKETWWDSGEVKIEAFDGFATFDILDGHLLESSDPKPAFLDSLRKPEIPRQVWRVSPPGTDGVKVVLLGDLSGLVAEYAESFAGPWTIVAYRKFDIFPDGSQGFVHQPPADATSGFYRLRVPTEAEKNALARKARANSP